MQRLRIRRPNTPIVLMDHSGYPNVVVTKTAKRNLDYSLRSMDAAFKQLVREGVKGLYRLTYEDLGMKAEMFVEGIHMSDYGMT